MRFPCALSIAALAALPLLVSGCGKKDESPNGVGPWQFGRSVLADAEAAGRCIPIEGGQMQCIGLSAMQVGGQIGEPQTYFASNAKDAKLVEIAITIRTCDAPAVAGDLSTRIGKPTSQSDDGKMLFWQMSTMFVRALVPDKKSGWCELNFVDPGDAQRIADLKAGK
jgi:hypothetical protein